MRNIWKPFQSLYFAALMMLIGSGLLSTYLALRLAADHVDSLWVGALMAANYFGLAVGGKVGHRLIGRGRAHPRLCDLRRHCLCGGAGPWHDQLATGLGRTADGGRLGDDVPIHGHRELAQ